jgi:hypothetical protein
MASSYYPKFPFSGDQVILASGRVHLWAKSDSVLIWGEKAVGLSSKQTINLDASQEILLDAPKVGLGHDATNVGQKVILGEDFVRYLKKFTSELQEVGLDLRTVAAGQNATPELANLAFKLSAAGNSINSSCNKLNQVLDSVLSEVTYTR